MPPRPRLARLPLGALLALAASAFPASALGADHRSIVYDSAETIRVLTAPGGAGSPLSAERGLLRQDPGAGGILDPMGRDAAYRVAKIDADQIRDLPAAAMAAFIRRQIDAPEVPNTSGMVAIDEIGNRFNDGRATITYSWRTVRGLRIRVASHNRLVITKNGYRIVRGPAPLPTVDPQSPGSRLSAAMAILSDTPHAAGGSYAQRVNLYIAPAFVTSIALGRGKHRNLGNDGKPHRATWRGVMPALAQAGGVWLEMYHYSGSSGVRSLTAREWRVVPGSFGRYDAQFGGDASRLHLMLSQATVPPLGAPATCGEPMACQWALAESTPAGQAVLANGPGAYALGAQAAAWRAEFNRVFA